MNLDDFAEGTGEWLRGDGPNGDVVISSRIRLARNLVGYPFLATAGDGDRAEVYRDVADAVTSVDGDEAPLLVDIHEAEELDRMFLVERHLISRQHALAEGSRGVAIWPGERRAVMVNEEDHLRIQIMRSGLQLKDMWDDATSFDDKLSERLDFAFDEELGYLTACPTNIGTGIRVSVMLHLPALKISREIGRVISSARDMRLAVRGLYGEGTDAVGDFYQISNQATLGKSEQDIARVFDEEIIPKMVTYERMARESLVQEHLPKIDDLVWRAYGVLSNTRAIGTDETLALLSHLRMGHYAGRFDKVGVETLNELFLHTQPAHLQKMVGHSLRGRERAAFRAEYLRKKLAC